MQYSVGIVLLTVLVLAPSATASFTPDSDVRNYALHVFEGDSTTNDGVVTDTFTFTIPHGYHVSERFSWFAIDANYLLEGGVGTRVREFTFESDAGHQCNWRVSIGSNLQALNSYRHMECTGAPIDSGTHTFWINSTAIAGSNPIVWSGYSIILHQHEEVDMSTEFETLTGMTALEFTLFPVLVALGITLWSRSLDPLVRLVGGLLPMVAGFLLLAVGFQAGFGNIWVGTFALVVMFALLSLYLLIRWGIDMVTEALA